MFDGDTWEPKCSRCGGFVTVTEVDVIDRENDILAMLKCNCGQCGAGQIVDKKF